MNPELHPALRIIGVIVLVLLLILGAWGIVTIAMWISGALSRPHPTVPPVTTLAPETLTTSVTGPFKSGTPFTLSWTHTGGTAAYGYAISYSCGVHNDVTLDAPLPTGSYKAVPCNTPFNYTNATAQMKLVPHVAASAAQGASVELTVSAINLATGTTTARGSAIASIVPSAPVTKTPPPSKGTAPTSNPNGVVDLSVQIISVMPGSAEFKISNVGTKTAPAGWIFTAQLPVSGGYTYTSPVQKRIMPGGYILNTLRWSYPQSCPGYQQTYPNQTSGCGTFSVTVDPYNASQDINRSNNYVSTPASY